MLRIPRLLATLALLLSPAITSAAEPGTIVIDPHARQGTWQGWGVSLAWWAGVFGDRDDLADALFTTKPVKLGPDLIPGLGMNFVRYNAGACSWNEVDGRKMVTSKIIQRYRQMEGFWLDPKSTDPESPSWNWSVDAKQRSMLTKAKERGVKHFELFSNSPMWWMTKNDNPSGGPKPEDDNLSPKHERDFAIYLATIARRAADQWGTPFTSVAPFNEPRSSWWFADCKQEGCHVSATAQARILPLVREELDRRGLKELPITASEETYYDHAIETWKSFSPEVKKLVSHVNVHGYQEAKGDRAGLSRLVEADGKTVWNSEYGDGDPTGLNMARNLHRDIAQLRAISWSYWQAVDGGGWGLIAGNFRANRMNQINPKWHVLAQYTRSIPSGAVILTTGDESTIAAYDADHARLTLICLNDSDKARTARIDLAKFTASGHHADAWLTQPQGSSRYQVLPAIPLQGTTLSVPLPEKSVQTFVIQDVRPK
ncbi:MAG: glycoside hydrolase [Luteolibacter sp.]